MVAFTKIFNFFKTKIVEVGIIDLVGSLILSRTYESMKKFKNLERLLHNCERERLDVQCIQISDVYSN